MTEKFEVPEPSAKALAFAKMADQGLFGPEGGAATALPFAYRADIPAIVRAEVERALDLSEGWRHKPIELFRVAVLDYLAARFPEAAPERHVAYQHVKGGVVPTPSAPAEWSKTEVWLSRDEVERRFGVKVTPDGQTQAERDFLRALAAVLTGRGVFKVEYHGATDTEPVMTAALDAARRVVEG